MFKTHESNMRKKSYYTWGPTNGSQPLTQSSEIRSAVYFLKLAERFGRCIGTLDVVKNMEENETYVVIKFSNGHVCKFRESEMFTPPMLATVVMFYDLPSSSAPEDET